MLNRRDTRRGGRTAAVLAVVLVALGAGAAIALYTMRDRTEPVASVRDVMPDTVLWYVESDDLRATWKSLESSQSWKDARDSSLVARVVESDGVQDFLAGLDELSRKVEYPVNAANVLKFVGIETAFGIDIDPVDEKLHGLLVARVDMRALAKDLLDGDMDFRALQEELNRRTEQAEFQVATRNLEGYTLTTARHRENVYFAILMEDVLAISTSRDLLERAVRTRIAKGAGSIGRLAAFTNEVSGFSDDAVITHWAHLAALDARRDELKNAIVKMSGDADAWMVDTALDALRTDDALAVALELPGGDLYSSTWSYSKPASEIFADTRTPDLAVAAPEDAVLYMEARRIGDLLASWQNSDLRSKIADTPLARKVTEFLENPGGVAESLRPGSPLSAPLALLEDAPGMDKFSRTFFTHALEEQLSAFFGGDLAVAVRKGDAGFDPPAFAVAVRLETDARFLEILGRVAHQRMLEEYGCRIVQEGDQTIRGYEDGPGESFYWAQLGDLLVVSNEVSTMRTIVRRAAATTPPAAPAAQASAAFEPGYHGFLHLDMKAIYEAIAAEQPAGMDRLSLFGLDFANSISMAVYVPEDFSRIETRTRATISSDADNPWRKATLGAEPRQSRFYASLPFDTFLAASAFAEFTAYWELGKKMLAEDFEADVEEAISRVSEVVEMDVERELLPAFGTEFGYAVLYRDQPPAGGPELPPGAGPPPIPGLVIAVEVRDERVVARALRNAVDEANRVLREASPNAPEARIVKDQVVGRSRYVLEFREQGIPFSPVVAVMDGFLLLASDPTVLRDMAHVADGNKPSFVGTELMARVHEAGMPQEGVSFSVLDWGKAIDQVSLYAPFIAQILPGEEVPFPDFPPDGNQREWQRRMETYQKAMEAQREKQAKSIRDVLDSFRVVDFIASWSGIEDETAVGTSIIQF